ncbi:guanine nucleotide binding-like protein (nucleomorph) [Guillardia theta]|uniref:Guanine nucleotide binding-like protein n=1 Tax=Guillardia theta TaxID=55529 RepID=Q98RR7_GUITH|nr:guanine nucleotide binding-like protein [Guillardia theta]AAK39880.1 guanine nucleotide binding-like protein [Guillardia theta]|mmetsp:Transcript_46196/g.144867  ORF Transcript_46196/g.144867 Transcript_46196/m.144867 type:complete len:681 (-) Transcript_46196:590-2632(-)
MRYYSYYNVTKYIGLHVTGNTIKFKKKTNEIIIISGRYLNFLNLDTKSNKLIDYGFLNIISSFDINSFSNLLVICDIGGVIKVIDLSTNKIFKSFMFCKFSTKVKLSARGKYISLLNLSNIYIFSVSYRNKSDNKKFNFCLHLREFSNIIDFDWNKSGEKIIYLTSDGYITIKDLSINFYSNQIKFFVDFNIFFVRFSTYDNFICLKKSLMLDEYKIVKRKPLDFIKKIKNFNFLDLKRNRIDFVYFDEYFYDFFAADYRFNIFHYKLNIFTKLTEKTYYKINYIKVYDLKIHHFSNIYNLSNYNLLVLLCFKKKNIIILNLDNQKFFFKHRNISDQISNYSVSNNSKVLALGNYKGEIQIWIISLNVCVIKYKIHIKSVIEIKFFKYNSRFLISSSNDGCIKIMDLKKLCVIKNFSKFKTNLKFFDINTNNSILFCSGSDNSYIYIWNIKKSIIIDSINSNTTQIIELVYINNNKLLSIDKNGLIKLWTIKFRKILKIKCINFFYFKSNLHYWTCSRKEMCLVNINNQISLLNLDNFDLIRIYIPGFMNSLKKSRYFQSKISVVYLNNGNLVFKSNDLLQIYVINRKKLQIISKIRLKMKMNKIFQNLKFNLKCYGNSGFFIFHNELFMLFQDSILKKKYYQKKTRIFNLTILKVLYFNSLKKTISLDHFNFKVNNLVF